MTTATPERAAQGGRPYKTRPGATPRPSHRPFKAERDHGITIFLDAGRLALLTGHADRLEAATASGWRGRFRSAALRDLIERGFPPPERASGIQAHADCSAKINVYMAAACLDALDSHVARVAAATGKGYNRSVAVRDLIDRHLSPQ